jgi:hypothetical protein
VCPPPPPPPPLPPPPLAASHRRTCTTSLRQRSCVSVADTGSHVETGNPVLDMANMLGIPRRPPAAAVLPGGKDSQQSRMFHMLPFSLIVSLRPPPPPGNCKDGGNMFFQNLVNFYLTTHVTFHNVVSPWTPS